MRKFANAVCLLILVIRLIDGVNVWRKSCLSLEPIRAMVGVGLAEYLHVPVTYLWSPSLVPKPPDWASNIGKRFMQPP